MESNQRGMVLRKCGRVSSHMVKEDAQAELEKSECNLPAVDPRQIKTSG